MAVERLVQAYATVESFDFVESLAQADATVESWVAVESLATAESLVAVESLATAESLVAAETPAVLAPPFLKVNKVECIGPSAFSPDLPMT